MIVDELSCEVAAFPVIIRLDLMNRLLSASYLLLSEGWRIERSPFNAFSFLTDLFYVGSSPYGAYKWINS